MIAPAGLPRDAETALIEEKLAALRNGAWELSMHMRLQGGSVLQHVSCADRRLTTILTRHKRETKRSFQFLPVEAGGAMFDTLAAAAAAIVRHDLALAAAREAPAP